MGFASGYLESRALFPSFIDEPPDDKTAIIVVIPSFNEPDINNVLTSLYSCEVPYCKVEVIIVINSPFDTSAKCIANNRLTIDSIESWKNGNTACFFRLFYIHVDRAPVNKWGVGLARKCGMDEAVRRFEEIGRPEGVILNLDADCTVEKNYFTEVYNEFYTKRGRNACSIYFEHPVSGQDYPVSVFKSIILYELHLRYYFQGLAYSGFPFVFHTVGSSVAVRAITYVKAGGMNRRQAGEDFYFIQKLLPLGGYFSINTTTVFPSPRPSKRVPFGTGATIQKLIEDIHPVLFTYNIDAFEELRQYFVMVPIFYKSSLSELYDIYDKLPSGIQSFIEKEEWVNKVLELTKNTSSQPSFEKRFFGWFNMFKIVKYLNFIHAGMFQKQPVEVSAAELLNRIRNRSEISDPLELLNAYRSLEKTR